MIEITDQSILASISNGIK